MKCKNNHHYSGEYCKICEDKPDKKKPKAIRHRSIKRASEERTYSARAKEYLKINNVCEVLNCNNEALQIHHIEGRTGELLTDINNFLAVCPTCHQYIELNPAWAKQQGYSVTRI